MFGRGFDHAGGNFLDGLLERDLRVRTQLAQADEVRQRLDEARAVQSTASGFMPEASSELATAALVQRLETVVSQASPGNKACAITNRVPQNRNQKDEQYPTVVVEVRLQCGTPELAAVLMALEGGSPRLFIADFNILPTRRFVLGSNRTQGNGGIDVSFELVGYLRPAPAAAEPADPELMTALAQLISLTLSGAQADGDESARVLGDGSQVVRLDSLGSLVVPGSGRLVACKPRRVRPRGKWDVLASRRSPLCPPPSAGSGSAPGPRTAWRGRSPSSAGSGWASRSAPRSTRSGDVLA